MGRVSALLLLLALPVLAVSASSATSGYDFTRWEDVEAALTEAARKLEAKRDIPFPSKWTPKRELGLCSKRGTCTSEGQWTDCVYNDVALPPGFSMDVCPQYQNTSCCDFTQYLTMTINMGLAKVPFGGCKACLQSFVNLWCAFTCSHNQAVFAPVLDVMYYDSHPTQPIVNHTGYVLSESFAEGIFDSCRNVHMLGTGQVSMQVLFSNAQNPMDFLKVLGQEKPAGNSPMLIDFMIVEEPCEYCMVDLPFYPCDDPDPSLLCTPYDCAGCSGPNVLEVRSWRMYILGSSLDRLGFALVLSCLGVFSLVLVVRAWYLSSAPSAFRGTMVALGVMGMLVSIVLGILCAAHPNLTDEVQRVETLNGTHAGNSTLPGSIEILSSRLAVGLFVSLLLAFMAVVSALLFVFWLLSRNGWPWSRGDQALHEPQQQIEVETPELQSKRQAGSSQQPSNIQSQGASVTDGPTEHKGGLSRVFFALGQLVARRPLTVIACGLLFTGLSCLGILRLEIETDPVKLWVPPTSDVIKEKNQFDEYFGPFYRTEQLILSYTPEARSVLGRSLWNNVTLAELRGIQARLGAVKTAENVTWEMLCNVPVPGRGCVLQSVTEYFVHPLCGSSLSRTSDPPSTDEVLKQMDACVVNFEKDECCWNSNGIPTFPYVVMGGFPEGRVPPAYLEADTLVVTYLLDNAPENTKHAEAWEKEWLDEVQRLERESTIFTFAYMAERSVSDELSRASASDIPTIAISYGVMFLYISLALGRIWPFNLRLLFVRTKFFLGLAAILVVVCSLAISVGLCLAAGVKVTPIISEVIPFLVLAIGIDNVFIILNNFSTRDPTLSIELRLAQTLAHVGTSITLASLSEAFAFMLGALTRMPAVQAFAYYSAVAILADYFLQLTVFCAALVLDARRLASGRVDCCPCFRSTTAVQEALWRLDFQPIAVGDSEDGATAPRVIGEPGEYQGALSPDPLLGSPKEDARPMLQSGAVRWKLVPKDGLLKSLMRRYYVPALLHPLVKIIIVVITLIGASVAITYMSTHLTLGLDQAIVVPDDSYLQPYFVALKDKLAVGPPAYFVIRAKPGESDSMDFSTPEHQNVICGQRTYCNQRNVPTDVRRRGCTSLKSHFATDAVAPSWMDDFLPWLFDPHCCSVFPNNASFCPPVVSGQNPSPCTACIPNCDGGSCFPGYNDSRIDTRPNVTLYNKYVKWFFDESVCDTSDVDGGPKCGVCGWAHLANVRREFDPSTNVTSTPVFRQMTFHTPLRKQQDYIDSIQSARDVAKELSATFNFDVFPYGVFYVYFEQYLYITNVAVTNALLAGAGIFVMCVILTRKILASILIMLSIALILFDLLGVMAAWGVDLNAVSVVNFVMAIGISVEFCIHIAVSFMRATGSNDERMAHALIHVGSSVISGITLTKFAGVVVLAFSKSKIFEVFYFRMYFAIVLLGAYHGLVFLPVLLSLVCPPSTKPPAPDSDSESDSSERAEEEYQSLRQDAGNKPYGTFS